MKYNIGDNITLPDGLLGIVTSKEEWITGDIACEVIVNGEKKNIIIYENGTIKYC